MHGTQRRNLRPRTDCDVPIDAGLPANHHEISDCRTAGYAHLSHDQAPATDIYVVPDLHLVVDLGALPDRRVAAGAAVDRRGCADLDIVLNHDPSDLRHFQMSRS